MRGRQDDLRLGSAMVLGTDVASSASFAAVLAVRLRFAVTDDSSLDFCRDLRMV